MSNPMIKIEMENGEADITVNGSGHEIMYMLCAFIIMFSEKSKISIKEIEGMIGTALEAFEKSAGWRARGRGG